jgi:4-hydroxy-3-methylbut-2-enyl diphosphate reductase
MKITIDSDSGFCFGVEKAIEVAEQHLEKKAKLYSLGQIVHNEEEISRLERKGMVTIEHDKLPDAVDAAILLRAHGEPPETYKIAKEKNLKIIDATCPIVVKLQKRVKKAYEEMKPVNGQVALFGKKNHPEAIGLAGQTDYTAIIIESPDEADNIDVSRPLRLFAQTTKNKYEYEKLVGLLKKEYNEQGRPQDFIHYNTVCKLVSGRGDHLKEFSRENDVVVFISGKHSSNGKYLYGICKSVNMNSYHISSPVELEKSWFKGVETVGISGATSTPKWLMEQVAVKIREFSFQ